MPEIAEVDDTETFFDCPTSVDEVIDKATTSNSEQSTEVEDVAPTEDNSRQEYAVDETYLSEVEAELDSEQLEVQWNFRGPFGCYQGQKHILLVCKSAGLWKREL